MVSAVPKDAQGWDALPDDGHSFAPMVFRADNIAILGTILTAYQRRGRHGANSSGG